MGTGGFPPTGKELTVRDENGSAPPRKTEREIAPHPSLKPQAFLRNSSEPSCRSAKASGRSVRGSGSTLAAAEAVGYASIGIEKDETYFKLALNRAHASEYAPLKTSCQTRQTKPVHPTLPEFRDAVFM
jgi:site-specific DNA-methyltransferase (adenine-specific)